MKDYLENYLELLRKFVHMNAHDNAVIHNNVSMTHKLYDVSLVKSIKQTSLRSS